MMVEGERVDASLDDASGLFGRVTQIGQSFQSPTEDPSICREVQISVNRRSLSLTLKVSLGFWPLYLVHGR